MRLKDLGETVGDIYFKLKGLNEETAFFVVQIQSSFEELGV